MTTGDIVAGDDSMARTTEETSSADPIEPPAAATRRDNDAMVASAIAAGKADNHPGQTVGVISGLRSELSRPMMQHHMGGASRLRRHDNLVAAFQRSGSRTNARTCSSSFTPGADSTPLAVSTQ